MANIVASTAHYNITESVGVDPPSYFVSNKHGAARKSFATLDEAIKWAKANDASEGHFLYREW